MNKPEFVMLVGLPGSGKSTYAQTLNETHSIHSSDAIREELFGDANENSKECNEKVFNTLHERVKQNLRDGRNVVYDATNLNRKRRIAFLKEIKSIDCTKKCIVIAAPFFLCSMNNKARYRVVPHHVMERMYKSFQPPYYNEGWDELDILLSGDKQWFSDYRIDVLYNKASGIIYFNQNNKHHNLTLGSHSLKVASALREKTARESLFYAGLLHDVGKIYTQSMLNKNGEYDGDCHYYNHSNVSAYESLFYMSEDYKASDDENIVDVTLYVASLIYFHMHPFNKQWNDTSSKVKRLKAQLGEELYNDIMLLHEEDKLAN